MLWGGAIGKNIKFNENVEFDGIQYKLEAIGFDTFKQNKSISGTITFPNTIKVIGWSAFEECSNITGELVFPESLTTISVSAFSGCSGLTGSLIFPETLTYIGASAFSSCSGLNESVSFQGEKIEEIGEYAFNNCQNIKTIILPDSIKKIGKNCFEQCNSLNQIKISKNLEEIGEKAFSSCTSLKNIDLTSNLKILPYSLFCSCTNLTSVTNPNSLEEIGELSFCYCSSLSSINLPSKLTKIGYSAFYGDAMLWADNSLFIPKTVESIGADAFDGTGFVTSCKDDIIYSNVDTNSNKWVLGHNDISTISTITFDDDTYGIEGKAFQSSTNLTTIILPYKNLTFIDYNAFHACHLLAKVENLELCDNLKIIGSGAFSYSNIRGILTLPKNLEYIDTNAFYSTNYEDLVIPVNENRTTKCIIGKEAFGNCTSLGTSSELAIPNYVSEIGSKAFYNTKYYDNAINGVVYSKEGEGLNIWCIGCETNSILKSTVIDFKDNTFGIAGGAFWNTNITEISNISSVKYIGTNAFILSRSLTKINNFKWSNDLYYIGDAAFEDCNNLECDNLFDFTNTKIERIGYSAFKNCGKINSDVTLPNTINYIGASAFNTNLKTFIIDKNAPIQEINSSTFNGCTNLEKVTLSNNIKAIDDNAFSGCEKLSSIELPENLETIGQNAFGSCTNLTNDIVMPKTLKYIGTGAFAQTKNVKFIFNSKIPCLFGKSWIDVEDNSNIHAQIHRECLDDYFVADSNILIENYDTSLIGDDFKLILKKDTLITSLNIEQVFEGTDLFEIQVPDGVSNEATYAIEMEDGSELPDWISIDENTGNITVNKPIEANEYKFKVTATSAIDPNAHQSQIITINVVNPEDFKLILKKDTLVIAPGAEQIFQGTDLFEIQVPDGISDDATYVIEMEDGSELPDWISIDEKTGNITINKPTEVNKYKIRVIATSTIIPNAYQSQIININVSANDNSWWLWLLIAILCLITAGVITLITGISEKKNKKQDDEEQNTETLNKQVQTQK